VRYIKTIEKEVLIAQFLCPKVTTPIIINKLFFRKKMMKLNFVLYRIHIRNAFYYLDTKAKLPATLPHPPQIQRTNVNFLITRMFYRVKKKKFSTYAWQFP